jgi:hypothetical protein
MTLYPLGYDGPDPDLVVDQFVTLDELAVTLVKAHPEFRRRMLAAIEVADGVVGIGGGWRSTALQTTLFLSRYYVDPNGSVYWNGQRWTKKAGVASAAPPGSSFHESQLFASGIWGFQAVDIVGADPPGHVAAHAWMAANGKTFGLKDFAKVNLEPWHIQCVGLPNSVSEWKSIGSPDPAPFDLPEEPVAVTYFKTAVDSLTIWATSDGLNASRLEEFNVKARGVDPFTVPVLPKVEVDKFTYHFGATAQSVR